MPRPATTPGFATRLCRAPCWLASDGAARSRFSAIRWSCAAHATRSFAVSRLDAGVAHHRHRCPSAHTDDPARHARPRPRRCVPGAPLPTSSRPMASGWRDSARRGQRPSSSPDGTSEVSCTARLRCSSASRSARTSARLNERQEPAAPVRWVNHWDNLDGTIERGYAGRSIFFENGRVLGRPHPRARLRTSAGVGRHQRRDGQQRQRQPAACITDGFIPQLARVADALRPWGVALSVSIDFSSPRASAGWTRSIRSTRASRRSGRIACRRDLPRDPRPWRLRAQGRLGRPARSVRIQPDARRRRQRDRACARAAQRRDLLSRLRLRPLDGLARTRRTIAPVPPTTTSTPLDGRFDANVVLQIKHGPIDFQVREPASPLFGALAQARIRRSSCRSRRSISASSATSASSSRCGRTVLDFDLQATSTSPGTPVRELVSGRDFQSATRRVRRRLERRARQQLARARPGDGESLWLRPAGVESDDLREADRRRLDDADLRARSAGRRDHHQHPARFVAGLRTLHRTARRRHADRHHRRALRARRSSRRSETGGANGTAPTEPASAWIERSATGTGFVSQYMPARRSAASSHCASTPDELLLFFHHVPYTHVLRSGKTVIQHIYDSALSGRGRRRPTSSTALAPARAADRSRSGTQRCSPGSSTRPGTPSSGVMR